MNVAVSPDQFRDTPPDQTRIYQFYKGDRVEDRDVIYQWLRSEHDGHWFCRVGDNGPEEFFGHVELWKKFNRKRYPMGYLPRRRPQTGHFASTDISSLLSPLEPEEQKKILYCVDWCNRFLRAYEAGEVKRTAAAAGQWAEEEQLKIIANAKQLHEDEGRRRQTSSAIPDQPKGSTLLDWVVRYERGNFDPIIFYDYTGKSVRKDHFTADELTIINEHVAMKASSDRTAVTVLHEMLKTAIERENSTRDKKNENLGATVLPMLRVPDIDTFRERVKKLPRGHIELAERGSAVARAKYAAVRTGIDVIRPLERIELDESRVDLQTVLVLAQLWDSLSQAEKDVVARVRLWITAAIDVATKSILGFRIHSDDPTAASAVSTLAMVAHDKTQLSKALGCETNWDMFGNPDEVAMDSATWLASLEMRIAVLDSGACFFQPRAGDARARGTIERWFRTVNREALTFFSGRTWGSIDEKGIHDAAKQASIAYDKYGLLIHRFLIDVYHNTPHHGLQGETPRAAWERLKKFYKPTPPMSPNIHRHIFGVKSKRKVSNSGIRCLGIRYWSNALHHLFVQKDQELDIRVDIADLGMISVRHEKGWLNVPAVHQEFAGMSLWKWMAFNQKLRLANQKTAQVHRAVAIRAKEHIRHEVEVARAEAQLGSAVVTDMDFRRWEKKLAYSVEILDDEEVDAPPTALQHDETTLTELYADMHAGMTAARAALKDETKDQRESRKRTSKNVAQNDKPVVASRVETSDQAAKPLISDRFSR